MRRRSAGSGSVARASRARALTAPLVVHASACAPDPARTERSFDLRRPTERATWRTCEAFEATWASFDSVPAPLMPEVPAADAIGLTLSALKRETIPSAIDEPAVELLGWLELPLDDAPALVVTSFNDGTVPQAVNSDPFLPNTMRGVLKLDDNERRYARDAYALAVLQASRRRLDLIVGQRTSDGDPLAPSGEHRGGR